MTYFKIKLSNGDSIALDEDELKPVCEGIRIKSPLIACKRGIFNAAFYVDIIPDVQRMREVEEMARRGEKEKEFGSPFAKVLGGGKKKQLEDMKAKALINTKI